MTVLERDSVYAEGLKDAIASSGFRQSELARQLWIDGSIISLWVHCKRPVPRDRLEQLARVLGVDVEILAPVPAHVNGLQAVEPHSGEPELAVELREDVRRGSDGPTQQPESSGAPAHPRSEAGREARQPLQYGMDGLPMGPGEPTFCSCGKQVR